MSALSERIAEVLRAAQCPHGDCSVEHRGFIGYVAERVAELFTEEVGWLTSSKGHLTDRRWVSEWSAVEQRPEPWEQDWIRESW